MNTASIGLLKTANSTGIEIPMKVPTVGMN